MPDRTENFRYFLTGYAAGVLVFLVLTLAGDILTGPCRGRVFLSLVAPFVLGPGGLGLAAWGWHRRGWGMMGLGMAVASLFPALFFAGRTLRYLQTIGCAPGTPGM